MYKSNLIYILKFMAVEYSKNGEVKLNTAEIGKLLLFSQQSASRWLTIMEHDGLINRDRGFRKERITITSKGWEILEKEYRVYKYIFDNPSKLLISGKITSGMGEGSYYITREGYLKQFKGIINMTPFPGTLNVKLDRMEMEKIEMLSVRNAISIDGFNADGRSFGPVRMYEASIDGNTCYIVLPERSHYKDIIELVSEWNIRKKLNLTDGDSIKIYVNLKGDDRVE